MKPLGINNKDLLAVAIATLITVFAWIGFQAYRTIVNKPIPSEVDQLTAPLNPKVREEVLVILEQSQP